MNEKQIIEKLKKIGISQTRISDEAHISQSTISNILSGKKRVSRNMREKLIAFINSIPDSCDSLEKFNEEFNSNLKKNIKGISKYFKDGIYKCYYCDVNGNVGLSKFEVNNFLNEINIKLNFENNEYLTDRETKSIYLREFEHYIEIHLTFEKLKNIHLFINCTEFPIEFSLGMLFYVKNRAPLTSKVIIEFIGKTSNDYIDADIKRFFNNKYLSTLKLPGYSILNKSELKTNLWAIQKNKNKGWKPIYFYDNTADFCKYDLYISTPINSITYLQLEKVKNGITEIMNLFKKKYKYENIFCKTINIDREAYEYREGRKRNLDKSSQDHSFFVQEVKNAIKNSSRFLFIDIEKKDSKDYQSAQIFQMGWALGHSSENLVYYFVNKLENVPVLIQNENLKNFKIIEASRYEDILKYFQDAPLNVYSIEAMEEEPPV
jgi:transcriptional regulator with XRE-family HTH domain